MRIFVTGGNGFIGRHLLSVLISSGHEVLSLERKLRPMLNCRICLGDLNQPDSYQALLRQFKPECAVHLAWEGLPDYSTVNCIKNLAATVGLFESLRQVECKRIFAAGTCWEYGDQIGRLSEDINPIHPSVFAAHKHAVNSIGKSLFFGNEINFIWGRLFFVYGPGQRSDALIPAVYRSFSEGKTVNVIRPDAANDFIHVADAVNAIKLLIESEKSAGTFNIGSGSLTPVWKVVNAICSNLNLPAYFIDSPISDVVGLSADVSRLRYLGWYPAIPLELGIEKTLCVWKN